MGIQERKERERAELKELILLKAKDILIHEGQEKLSIRRLAQAVEYSPATIYLYFADKDEIMHELMEMGFSLMNKAMDDAFSEPDPVLRIRKIGHAYVHFGLQNKDWYDLMFVSEQPMNHIDKCKSEWGHGIGLFEYLSATCKEAISIYSFNPEIDPRILALNLWSIVHGLVTLAQSQRLDIVEKDRTEELIESTLNMTISVMFRKSDNA